MAQWFSGFEINTSYLILMNIFLFVGGVLFAIRLLGKLRKLNAQLVQLQNEVRAINSGNLVMGRKISQFAEEIANVELEPANTTSDVSEKTYKQAGLLLERGATIEEVVETCEIAPAEAELLAVMRHSKPS
ncbi:MAG: DUF2802 domain-containing protein [Enterobacterales bacterium]|nr:DUF2802 domain-containing protein [Enterobacterales bacterium]